MLIKLLLVSEILTMGDLSVPFLRSAYSILINKTRWLQYVLKWKESFALALQCQINSSERQSILVLVDCFSLYSRMKTAEICVVLFVLGFVCELSLSVDPRDPNVCSLWER